MQILPLFKKSFTDGTDGKYAVLTNINRTIVKAP